MRGLTDPVLPDILEPNLRIVFCGSAASKVSAVRSAYYANPQNRFWRTLREIDLTDRLLEPAEFRDLLTYRLGLTDMAKGEFGNDTELSRDADDPDALRARILKVRPRILAFVGKRPAQVFFCRKAVEYGLQAETLDGIAIYVVPSTSPAARRYWDIGPWRALAAAARDADDAAPRQKARKGRA